MMKLLLLGLTSSWCCALTISAIHHKPIGILSNILTGTGKMTGCFLQNLRREVLMILLMIFQSSFNTYQKYTNYRLVFPNAKIRPKISGNYEIIVYKDSQDKPLFTKRFCIVEDRANVGVKISRFSDARKPQLNQRVEVQAVGNGSDLMNVANSISLHLIQNNNFGLGKNNVRPSSTLGNRMLFQQMTLTFPGNNEFYYFDNKIINQPFDMVSGAENIDGINQTYLFPVWAYPENYQYQPDVNGAFYFRRNDLGIERDADREGDYSWVYFALDSQPMDRKIFVLGQFNDYKADKFSEMYYDDTVQKYIARIYLKQGFYNYILATQNADGTLNYGEINGNFWQTENLYQAFLYYTPFGRSYDGLLGYGEYRNLVQ